MNHLKYSKLEKSLPAHTYTAKIPAEELHSTHLLPTCGLAEPFEIKVKQQEEKHDKYHVNKISYNIRKSNPNISFEESVHEAHRRIQEKASLKYSNPNELTLDECRLIGFWLADGSVNHLRRCGIEYTLAQSEAYPNIIAWIDNVLHSIGVHFLKRRVKPSSKTRNWSVRWSIPRGTGSGPQHREGLYRLEPYLDKNGSELFWGFDEKQFDALLEGFWYGDGDHHAAENGMPNSIFFNGTSKTLLDLLCAIGCVRNWRCRMSVIPQKNPRHRTQYGLGMIKGDFEFSLTPNTKIVHEEYKDETVWCVRTTSKNIITRRNGRITVMGNTEGWDEPSADCICVLRPTKVRSLYVQMVGRGTRLSPGKQDVLLLDFLWMSEKHDLVRPCSLVAKNPDLAARISEIMQEDTQKEAVDLMEAEEKAESTAREEREESGRRDEIGIVGEDGSRLRSDFADRSSYARTVISGVDRHVALGSGAA